MTLALGHGEVADVVRFGPGATPQEFIWRGRRHIVEASQRPSRREAGMAPQGVRVRTTAGLRCLLVRRDGRWLVVRLYG